MHRTHSPTQSSVQIKARRSRAAQIPHKPDNPNKVCHIPSLLSINIFNHNHTNSTARPTHTARESIWDDKSPFSVLRTSSSIGRRAGSALSGTGSGGGSAHGHQASPSLSASGAGAGSGAGIPTRASNANANVLRQQAPSPAIGQQIPTSQSHSQFQAPPQQQNVGGMVNYSAPGMRSLAEIEAEMRAVTLKAREQKMQEQLLLQQQQQAQQAQQAHQQQQQFLQQQHAQQHQIQNQAQHLTKPPRMRSQSPSTHTHQHPHQHQQHALPMNAPQAGYQIPPQVMDTYRQQQQQGLLHEVESLRLQEAIRAHRKDGSADLSVRNNNTHTPIDPVEYVLQKSAERERGVPQGMNMGVNMNMGMGMGLPHGRSPALPQPQPQPRFDEFDYERSRPLHGPAEDFHTLRRHIVAEQQQRRASPMDALQHQMRLALANEMASKARGESGTPGIGGGLGIGVGGGGAAAAQEHAQLQQYLQQQRMLAQLAQQQEFAQGLNGVSRQELLPAGATNSQREHLQVEAMRKIMEAEKQEGRRRRKAQKIAHMVCLLFVFPIL